MELIIHWIIILLGVILIVYLIRFDRIKWLGVPLIILVIEATHDLGFGPIINKYFYSQTGDQWIGRMLFSEKTVAMLLILLCYICIAVGMRCAVYLWPAKLNNSNNFISLRYSNNVLKKGWIISIIFFGIGCLANLAVLAYLLPGRSLFSIAYERALFTDNQILSMPLYHYLRTLSALMQYGALGMLFFYMRKKSNLTIALIANLSFIAFQALFGGRQRVIVGSLVILLGYHYGVMKLKFKQIIVYFLCGYIFLIFISYVRFEAVSLIQAIIYPIKDALNSWRLDQAAFIIRNFPSQISFSGNINMFVSIVKFLPSISISGNSNLWFLLVEKFWSNKNPAMGIGGENFPTSAELYSWGGFLSVVIFALFAGLFFGMIFEWQRRDNGNIFKKIFILLVWANIFNFESRLPVAIGNIIYIFVPVSIMAAISLKSKNGKFIILLLILQIITFIAFQYFRDLGLNNLFKYMIIASLPILYFLCYQVLQKSGPNMSFNGELRKF
jgi:hypothetical protein